MKVGDTLVLGRPTSESSISTTYGGGTSAGRVSAGGARTKTRVNKEFEFIRLGRFLERIDMISRIIDCLCITKSDKKTYDFSTMEWISLLSILSAQDAFRKVSKGEVDREEVINFLLQDDSFPRSITRCLSVLRLCLDSLPKNEKIILKIRTLRLRFDTASFENFDDNKLHIFLDKCQKDLIAIDKLVEKTYF